MTMQDALDETSRDETPAESGLQARADGDGVHIRMWGEVDAALRDDASLAMTMVMTTAGRIVIEAPDVAFIDSSGLAFVLQLHRHGREEGRDVVLRNPSERLLELLELVAVDSQFDIQHA